MPSSSGAQHRFMAMASTSAGRAKLRAEGKNMPSQSVATEFRHADKGKHFSTKGMRKKK
jgi:hypothetical protein